MADHPLRPATRQSLGEPLPHQQADKPRAHLTVRAPEGSPPLVTSPCEEDTLWGISPGFPELSPSARQVAHVLRTHPPVYSPPEGGFLPRLACVRHAASVRPEPGSNPPLMIPEGWVGHPTRSCSRTPTVMNVRKNLRFSSSDSAGSDTRRRAERTSHTPKPLLSNSIRHASTGVQKKTLCATQNYSDKD